MTTDKQPLPILAAIDDERLFRPFFREPATWSAWRAFLCAAFALPMSADELTTFKQCTGRENPPQSAVEEAWLVCGRRGGKSFTLSLISVYLAVFRDWRPYLSSGERAHVVVIAADRKQSRTIFAYIRSLLVDTPMLADLVVRETGEEIDLKNRVTLEVATCSYRTIRGRTIVAALCDEIAFWQSEGSTNPDEEVLSAIRPAMATVPGAMLLCASSPYARRGVMWDVFNKYHGVDDARVLVWRASTQQMNPTVSQRTIDEAYERDSAVAAAEYGAEFRTDVERLLTIESVRNCIRSDASERLPFLRNRYVGFVDPSGGSADSMTFAVAHREGDVAVLDLIREWKPPFSPEFVVEEVVALCRKYRLSKIRGDRYGGDWAREPFRQRAIHYEVCEKSKSEIYSEFVAVINSGACDLLNHPRLLHQLVGLERTTSRAGRDSIDHPRGGHDDIANAVAGALVYCPAAARVDRPRGEVEHIGAGSYNPLQSFRRRERG